MLAWLNPIFALVSGIAGPITSAISGIWTNKQNTYLDGFKTASGTDQVAYAKYLDYALAMENAKASANSWWGARFLYLFVGFFACLHTVLIFIDSSVRLGCGHYGCLGVPSLPSVYADFEHTVIYSLYVTALVAAPLSGVTAWLHRK